VGAADEPRRGTQADTVFARKFRIQRERKRVSAGHPKLLFQGVGLTAFDVSAGGTRCLFPIVGAGTTEVPFTVALNWIALLKK